MFTYNGQPVEIVSQNDITAYIKPFEMWVNKKELTPVKDTKVTLEENVKSEDKPPVKRQTKPRSTSADT